ncbi:hypothetical protein AC578_510 [Pseudocercospora eumusae]|uniref:Uncharacterized protein n=1 Tax=Pseudocercospora eumusae TaxID=321146 RepID=A0A139HY01_9PEZI|nr:hypothetical protein AC578_510 [Pseudocercospora eumusae]
MLTIRSLLVLAYARCCDHGGDPKGCCSDKATEDACTLGHGIYRYNSQTRIGECDNPAELNAFDTACQLSRVRSNCGSFESTCGRV